MKASTSRGVSRKRAAIFAWVRSSEGAFGAHRVSKYTRNQAVGWGEEYFEVEQHGQSMLTEGQHGQSMVAQRD